VEGDIAEHQAEAKEGTRKQRHSSGALANAAPQTQSCAWLAPCAGACSAWGRLRVRHKVSSVCQPQP